MPRGIPLINRRPRGNPKWGRGIAYSTAPAQPTEFEVMLARAGLEAAPKHLIISSVAVKAWVQKHYSQRYVPEYLLKAYGLDPAERMDWG